MQAKTLGDDEEDGARRTGAEELNEEDVGFDEADWDKKQAEVPFL